MIGNRGKWVSAALAGCLALAGASARETDGNPYSPRSGHPYRHGAVPTREAAARMRGWNAARRPTAAASNLTLSYAGGVGGVGVVSGVPKVYLVIYGSQWGTSGTDADGNMTLASDAVAAVPFLQRLFKAIGSGGELWSGTVTQYCDGALVAQGATACPAGALHIGYPSGGAFAGIWYDDSAESPMQATGKQLAEEAIAAAAHFGNLTADSNRYAQYVILSPPGTDPDGYNLPSSNFCAWHDFNSDPQLSGGPATSAYGDIAFTNLPYLPDAGTSCGANEVNPGVAGELDGVSLTAGHEYAETLTDPLAVGWYNQTGDPTFDYYEIADECDGALGYGLSANVTLGADTFPMQALWSNDTQACEIAHPVIRSDPIFANGFD